MALLDKLKIKKNNKNYQLLQNNHTDYVVDNIIHDAIKQSASDVHFEPGSDYYKIRIRIDGKLQNRLSGRMSYFQNMINRIKVLANMNIAEKRSPQDGALRWENPLADIRVSTIPTIYGEKCVIRILKSRELSSDFVSLGMTLQMVDEYKKILKKSNGMVLVTGPTGSGKSTTLYTTLNYLNNEQDNIVTIEDPVEYMIDGINQMQIHEERDVTFSTCLRSILRQDPDVIMIGEIRDHQTADMAVRASLTGHKILSTLHTENAVSAMYRLIDMDVQDYLAVQGVKVVIAQRLLRKKCLFCSGIGCDVCFKTGYYGRIAVFELLKVTDDIIEMLLNRQSVSAVYEMLRKQGWNNILDHAKQLLEQGVIDDKEYMELYYSIV